MKKKKEEGNRNEDGEREREAKREKEIEMEYKRGKERWSIRERKKDGV